MPNRTLLIDADVVAFKLASSCQETVIENGFVVQRFVDMGYAQDQIDIYIESLLIDLHADDIVVCMSDPSSRYFRHEIYPKYKGSRSKAAKPIK